MKPEKTDTASNPDAITPGLDNYNYGRSLRKNCPRSSHSLLQTKDRPDLIAMLVEKTKGRIEELLPIHYERILESPFAYYRGTAGIMAADLARTQSTGMHIQICGDCHLMNFGGFATPERKIVFDIDDFDETLTGPWEWDVKRLAASFMIAGQWKGFSKSKSEAAAYAAVRSYKKNMAKYAGMPALQTWYDNIELGALIKPGADLEMKNFNTKKLEKVKEQSAHEKEFDKMAIQKDGRARIVDQPPLLYHVDEKDEALFLSQVTNAYTRYLETISDDRKLLLSKYTIQDAAMKVVGVGSVGTWCGVLLLMSDSGDPLFLQFKEAHESVLEPFTEKSPFDNHGQRVVEGQKLMQSASDIFLGWTKSDTGRDYYIRQLRDAKIKPNPQAMNAKNFLAYATSCGWALAHAHARTGDAAIISGYIGNSGIFEKAITKFAADYQQLNEQDYQALVKAVKNGVINVN